MNKHLCSKNFQAFFDTLIADSFPSANLIHEEMKKQISIVAEDINLGQMTAIYVAPQSQSNPAPIHEVCNFYVSPEGFNDDQIFEKSYGTGENGSVMYSVNPKKGVTWDEQDLRDAEMISDITYLFSYRARLIEKVKEMKDLIESKFGPRPQ
ncbi:MAG: hypothetical protein SOZ72_09375 [Treponema sp.]|nr:hypothetical protein [Spirochaetia bacterium]MCI7440308.1 hypothetical protein [Spirochaetia bacterium]MDD7580474.1 hypothetical protein [Treponema sp.]MDY3759569.1 hypothetical protein [Treponema sp.]MDY5837453.1 hypothetical protein [Treponema sp.]